MLRSATLPEDDEELTLCRLEGCGKWFKKSVHNQAFCGREHTKEYTNKKILQQYHDRKDRDLKNRVCIQDGCDTVLSIYNPDDLCGVHQQQEYVAKLKSWGFEDVEDDFTL